MDIIEKFFFTHHKLFRIFTQQISIRVVPVHILPMWVHFNGSMAKAYFELFMEHNGQKNIFEPEQVKELRNYIAQLMELQKEKDLGILSDSVIPSIENKILFSAIIFLPSYF